MAVKSPNFGRQAKLLPGKARINHQHYWIACPARTFLQDNFFAYHFTADTLIASRLPDAACNTSGISHIEIAQADRLRVAKR